MKTPAWLLCAALVSLSVPAQARDWFVREGATGGDGSQARPFADPWQALDKCEANDAIHVAGGKYYGANKVGTWALPFDGVQLIGGYDRDFTERDPWKNLTQLLWDKTSKNWPKDARLSSLAANTVIDGVVIDMRQANHYLDDTETGRTTKPGEDALYFPKPVTVRNSVIVNPGQNGITCSQGSTIENNLILNALGWGVVINNNSAEGKSIATVKNNTILFSQDDHKPGGGGYAGAAVALKGPAIVTNNILANSDNNAVYMTVKPEKVTLTHNVFFMSLFSNLKFGVDGVETAIDDKQMGDLEEVGLKAFEGNTVMNPQLDLDPKWLDRFSKRTAGQPGKLEMNDWNKARQLLGLPMIEKGGEAPSGVAPAYDVEKALRLMQPKAAGLKAGARKVKLEAKFSGVAEAAPQRSYQRVEVSAFVKSPQAYEGKPVELIIAIGTTTNISGMPKSYKKDDHDGATFYEGGEERGGHPVLVGFYKKGTSAQRFVNDNAGWYTGSGKTDKLFVARGLGTGLSTIPHAGLYVESLEPYEGSSVAAARPTGRDWFVRAGASGGDGSKDKPFKDPWQALEKVESGDSVHVAEGEYFGKLRAGQWKIDLPNVALIGGYDANFTERNPWKHPTRLGTAPDYKMHRSGYTIEGTNDHTGAIIDGFIFDKRLSNAYHENKDLNLNDSDHSPQLWLGKPGCIVRNNVFLNGAEGSIKVGGGMTVENNIFINFGLWVVNADRGYSGTFVFRHNTVLFSWDHIVFGKGGRSTGYLLALGGGLQAIVDNNIFEFADNDAVRMAADAKDVELTNNTFSKNLWSNVQRAGDWTSVDDKDFAQLADLKFKKEGGNQVAVSGVPLDKAWFDIYLGRTAAVPGKVKMDDWNQLREILDQPVIATGGKAGEGFAPAYDWKKATELFPKNKKITAGARAQTFPVSFSGAAPKAEGPAASYDDTTWDVAKSKDAWEKLSGNRVALKIVIRDPDNTYHLDDIKQAEYLCFTTSGPEGLDSGGLPLRAYVKKGTKAERVVQQAKSYSSGTPEQTYVIKGVARANRQMVVEVVERAD